MAFQKGVKPKGSGPKRRPGELTTLQSRFIDEYLKDLEVAESSRRAGTTPATGHSMMRLAHVQREIKRRIQLRSERAGIDADRTLVELARIGYSDIGDVLDWKTERVQVKDGVWEERTVVKIRDLSQLSAAARASIAEIKQTKNGIQVKFHNKVEALNSLAKHQGLFSDEVKLTIPVQFIVERSGDRKRDEAPPIEGTARPV